MSINSKPLDRELTQEEQLVANAFFQAKRDAARATVCADLSPWVFRYDNKFVCMLKCSEGPVEEMTLVNSCHEATTLFGKDLFDSKQDRFDAVTKACYQILLHEPCYIVRTFRPAMVSFKTEKDSNCEVTSEMGPKQVTDKLEEFLSFKLKATDLKEWPTRGNPIHWHIVVKDEDWFNEFAHLHQNEDPNKGDFTEIHYVPGFLIKLAGWRGNVMFTVPLYPKEEKPVYTLKEGIEKLSEFIIAGKIEILGFEYN